MTPAQRRCKEAPLTFRMEETRWYKNNCNFLTDVLIVVYCYLTNWASLVAQLVKESACNAGHLGLTPGSGRSPGGGHGQPTPVPLPEEFQGLRSLACCSPWSRKESDATKHSTAHKINQPKT